MEEDTDMKRRTHEAETGTTHIVNRYEAHGDGFIAITECGLTFETDKVSERIECEDVCGRCE